jgi:hypothetical protein
VKTVAAARDSGLAGLDRDARRRRNRVEHFCQRLRDELDRIGADDEAVLAFHEAAALLRTRELVRRH